MAFALRDIDPWPPKGPSRSRDLAREVVEQIALSGFTVTRPLARPLHSTPASSETD